MNAQKSSYSIHDETVYIISIKKINHITLLNNSPIPSQSSLSFLKRFPDHEAPGLEACSQAGLAFSYEANYIVLTRYKDPTILLVSGVRCPSRLYWHPGQKWGIFILGLGLINISDYDVRDKRSRAQTITVADESLVLVMSWLTLRLLGLPSTHS